MKWLSNIGALQFFQVLRFGTLIFIGIILVKSGYSTSEIGHYEFFFFLANLVSFFWVMGLNNGLISYYPSLSEERKSTLLFNVGILLLSLAGLAGLVLFLFKAQVADLARLESGKIKYLKWIIAYMVLSAPGNFTEYFYLLKDQKRNIIKYGSILFLLQGTLVIFGVLMAFTIEGLLKLMVLWALFKFLWFWVLAFRFGRIALDLKIQLIFLGFSAPLIVHMLLGNGMEYVDGFLVSYFFDTSTFAQFRYGARELPLVTVLIGAISTALIPVAVSNMGEALITVKNKISRMANLLFPISILLMLMSPWLFTLAYSSEYLLSAQIFNVYLLVITSRILMPQVVLFARHNTRILMYSALLELFVNVALSLWFLKTFGILGIAWATVVAYMVNKVILMVYAWRKHNIQPTRYVNLKQYLIWLSLLLFSYYISNLIHY